MTWSVCYLPLVNCSPSCFVTASPLGFVCAKAPELYFLFRQIYTRLVSFNLIVKFFTEFVFSINNFVHLIPHVEWLRKDLSFSNPHFTNSNSIHCQFWYKSCRLRTNSYRLLYLSSATITTLHDDFSSHLGSCKILSDFFVTSCTEYLITFNVTPHCFTNPHSIVAFITTKQCFGKL